MALGRGHLLAAHIRSLALINSRRRQMSVAAAGGDRQLPMSSGREPGSAPSVQWSGRCCRGELAAVQVFRDQAACPGAANLPLTGPHVDGVCAQKQTDSSETDQAVRIPEAQRSDYWVARSPGVGVRAGEGDAVAPGAAPTRREWHRHFSGGMPWR